MTFRYGALPVVRYTFLGWGGMFAGLLEMVERISRARTCTLTSGVVDLDVGVDTASLAHKSKFVSCAAIGSEVERRRDALVGVGGVLVSARARTRG